MIEALVLAALLSVPHPPSEVNARALASVVTVAALDRPLWPTVTEVAPTSPEVAATALLLAAVAYHESAADPRVARCEIRGSDDTVTAFQLLGHVALAGYTKSELCAFPQLAAYVSLRVFELHQRRCPSCSVGRWLAGYAAGDMGVKSKAAGEIHGIFWRFAKVSGVDISGPAPRWK